MKKLFLMAAMLFAVGAVSAQEKETLCVDNFTNSTTHDDVIVKQLRNEVIAGISATGRLSMADVNTLGQLPSAINERLKALNEKTINYVLEGTLNSIEEKTSQSSDKKKTYYEAVVNYTLTVINTETGETMASETKKESWTTGATRDEAISKAIENVKSNMKKFVDTYFKVEATIKAIDQFDKKKDAKTVYISIGSAMGISKGQIFEVFSEVNVAGESVRKKIGELRAKEVMSATLTLCDVKSGGKEIKEQNEKGIKMSVVSRAKVSIFDRIDKVLE